MTGAPLSIAFFGSSLVSAYWNGAATYYRGILRALAARGHRITFFEPDAYDRQRHRDIEPPDWAAVVVYAGADGLFAALARAAKADLVIKASGVGLDDGLLEDAVAGLRAPHRPVAFWDVDAPATLARIAADPADPFRALIPRYDLILTYGGGAPVVSGYRRFGARACVPIYNGLDPATHHPVAPDPRFACDLALLANRLPDREARIDDFFFTAARRLPDRRFVLGGNGWDDKARPANVDYRGHVYTRDHNALNASALAVLNVSRDSMAQTGFSPATRVFEAAGAGACLISDAWDGIDLFFEPEREILVAHDGAEVAERLARLTPERARAIGAAACARALAEHTYDRRVLVLERALDGVAA
jgi:spore maturation protein CgeB